MVDWGKEKGGFGGNSFKGRGVTWTDTTWHSETKRLCLEGNILLIVNRTAWEWENREKRKKIQTAYQRNQWALIQLWPRVRRRAQSKRNKGGCGQESNKSLKPTNWRSYTSCYRRGRCVFRLVWITIQPYGDSVGGRSPVSKEWWRGISLPDCVRLPSLLRQTLWALGPSTTSSCPSLPLWPMIIDDHVVVRDSPGIIGGSFLRKKRLNP